MGVNFADACASGVCLSCALADGVAALLATALLSCAAGFGSTGDFSAMLFGRVATQPTKANTAETCKAQARNFMESIFIQFYFLYLY
jgi:hypothetical protein